MPQRKIFVATRILVFDFELFIGVLFQVKLSYLHSLRELPTEVIILTYNICFVFMRMPYYRFM